MGVRLFADAVEVLADDLADGLNAEVGHEADRSATPPLQVERAVVEPDPGHLVLHDRETGLAHHRFDRLQVQEWVGDDHDLGNTASPEDFERPVQDVLAVQVRLATSVDVCCVGLCDGHVQVRQCAGDFPLCYHDGCVMRGLAQSASEFRGHFCKRPVHRVGFFGTLRVRKSHNANGHEIFLSNPKGYRSDERRIYNSIKLNKKQ